MLGRLLIAAFVLLFLVALVSAVWNLCDWPPPRLILKHGFPPTGGPTGRTMTIEGVEFVELKPGYFRMGSHFFCRKGDLLGRICALLHLPWGNQTHHNSPVCPPQWVEIGRAYWITRTELTNDQYERFDPEHVRDEVSMGDKCPAVNLRWDDAQRYCDWLSARASLRVHLPSEAEWEYACRAGSTTGFFFGENPIHLNEYAWFAENADLRIHETGTLRSNNWGLLDMLGNVSEMCEDAWALVPDTTASGAYTPRLVPETFDGQPLGVVRGGSAGSNAWECRCGSREPSPRGGWSNLDGLRLAASFTSASTD